MKIQSPFLTRMVATFLVVILRAIYGSCKIRMVETVPGTSPYRGYFSGNDERFLYSIWHDILLMAIFCGKPEHMAGLVSRHQDGSYLADVMKMVGLTPIRGSSKRGGSQAARQCLDAASEYHVSITPDGPRGPRHEMKEGIVFLASQSGRRIVPISARCKRYWRIQGKWTDMLIPKPFTTVEIHAGAPITIPSGLNREQLREEVRRVQQAMNELEEYVDRRVHPEKHTELTSVSQYETISKAA
ncbi:MAG: lysophospholipid acyltransferase family protein [Planctomycetaceae bacterium]|nr:lysophospholipid acyltransferase family protein [Planctomycetaceae bacterium]